MIKFQRERVMYCQKEIVDNFDYHKKDIKDYTLAELSVNWDAYSAMEDIDAMCFVTARDEEELVGYVAFLLSKPIHHDVLYATATITYIRPDHRGKGISKDMLSASAIILKRLKVHTMMCTVVDGVDYSPMLKREGFKLAESNYTKEL